MLTSLFDQALELPRVQREGFVRRACANDTELCDELSSLLQAHDSAADYFEDLSGHLAPALASIAGSSNELSPETLNTFQVKLGNAYRVERELGGAGMSRVFLAEDARLKRRVVIKVLPPEMAATFNADRFEREIELAAKLQHPHIVPLLTSGSAEGTSYYTMPFVAGETLRERLARENPIPLNDALQIWRDVLDALAYAHANDVIHRDIKPDNILLSGRNALVADFGVARAIETATGDAWATAGLAVGTPAYMAPEQAAGARDVDERLDIYAAGLLMYEMLAGAPPFSAVSVRELLYAHLTREPPRLSKSNVPEYLADLIARCLAKDPNERPQSADAIITELDDAGEVTGRKKQFAAWYAFAAALVIGVVFFVLVQRDETTRSTAAASPTIAVLPLTNRSADPADAALASGMTQELTSILGKNTDLRVIASTSVSALPASSMDVQQIARRLRVSHVLEGSLQKAESRLRIQLRLVDARDGSTRWSETYDRAFADVFNVQEEIARAVAEELAARLEGQHRGRSTTGRTPHIAAYEWYLRGMDLTLLRSRTGLLQGVGHFERAIAIDSTYAAAYAGLVRMYLSLWNAAPPAERQMFYRRAREAAQKAVALDKTDPNAAAAHAWFLSVAKAYGAAEIEFKRAIALDSAVPRGHEGLARVYMMLARPREQLAAARTSVERDPLSHSAIRELALALATNGRCEESLDQLRGLKMLTPPAGVAGVLMGQCYGSREMWPAAIAEFRWANANSAAFGLAFLGHALARAGQNQEAGNILSDLLAGRKHSHGSFGIATVYAGMKNYNEAFAWLDKAVTDNSVNSYIMHPFFRDLHSDPRFDRIRRRLSNPIVSAAP